MVEHTWLVGEEPFEFGFGWAVEGCFFSGSIKFTRKIFIIVGNSPFLQIYP
jgi:hypothetical protein